MTGRPPRLSPLASPPRFATVAVMNDPSAVPSGRASSPAAKPRGDDPVVIWSGIGLLVSFVAAIFWQTRRFGLVFFDDGRRLAPLLDAGFTRTGVAQAFAGGSDGPWQPFTTLSLMFDAAVFGDRWGGYHLHNVVLHAVASALLFAALTKLTGAMGRSVVAAGFFAIHPLRAESVAWIAGRADVLGGVFFAATLLAYAHFVEKPASRARYAVVAAYFACGLLCTGALVALPLGLLILDWWPLRRMTPFAGGRGFARAIGRWSRTDVEQQPLALLIREKLPLVALAAGFVAIAVLRGDAAPAAASLLGRLVTGVTGCATNALHLVWPVGLAPRALASADVADIGTALAAVLGIAAVTAAAWRWRHRWPSLTAGWAWYLALGLPTVVLFPGLMPTTADRCTYFSQIWLIVAILWGMGDYADNLPVRKRFIWAVAMAGLLLLIWACYAQVLAWRDGQALWNQVIATVHNEPAGTYDPTLRVERAAALNPTFAAGLIAHGDALYADGGRPAAEEAWLEAAALEPGLTAAWGRLARARLERGDSRPAPGAAESAASVGGPAADAEGTLRRALAAAPDSPIVLFHLATLLERQGAAAEAATLYRRTAERVQAAGAVEDMAGAAAVRAASLPNAAP